jgi:hypothetical protein
MWLRIQTPILRFCFGRFSTNMGSISPYAQELNRNVLEVHWQLPSGCPGAQCSHVRNGPSITQVTAARISSVTYKVSNSGYRLSPYIVPSQGLGKNPCISSDPRHIYICLSCKSSQPQNPTL